MDPSQSPDPPGQSSPLLWASLFGMSCQKKGKCGYLAGYQHMEGTQIGCKVGLTWSWEVRGCWCLDFSVVKMPPEERTMQRSVHIRECSLCQKQKRQGYCFSYSSKLYQLLNLQIDAKFFPVSMWRHSFSSTLYYLESRKHYVKVMCVCWVLSSS